MSVFCLGLPSSATNVSTLTSTLSFSDIGYYDIARNLWFSIGDLPTSLNTPVCDYHEASEYLYCFTGNGQRLAARIQVRR